jgi:hypothetical protein
MGIRLSTNEREKMPKIHAMLLGVILLISTILLITTHKGPTGDIPERRSTTTTTINDSGDGRYQTCGIITEEGVTEYIDAYIARCGDIQVLEP